MRCFLALPLPEDVQDALEALQDRLPSGRAVEPGNMHLTLAFLGERGAEELDELDVELQSLRQPAFMVELRGLGTFGERSPRVLHAEVAPNEALDALHSAVAGAVRRAGLPMERRRFRPHVTLARYNRPLRPDAQDRLAAFLQANGDFRLPPFEAAEVALYRSILHRDGASYEALARYPLIGGMDAAPDDIDWDEDTEE